MSLLCIIPTRSRPEQCERLLESFIATTDKADLLFVTDPDDDSYEDFDWKGHMAASLSPRGTMVQKLNFAASQFLDTYDQMVWYADDNEFITPHWDTLMLDALKDMGGSGWVYSNDNRRSDIPETWLVSTDVTRNLGFFANPILHQYYVADSVAVIAKRARLLRYCPDVVVTHHHYTVNKNTVYDETYFKAEQAFGGQDLRAFQEWSNSPQVAAAVSKLRRAFNPDVSWVKNRK